jgi:hypothetical protein
MAWTGWLLLEETVVDFRWIMKWRSSEKLNDLGRQTFLCGLVTLVQSSN